jgi:hypothetical protein
MSKFCPKLEVLEDRNIPYINAYNAFIGGALVITPPTTVPQPIEIAINKQLVNIVPPNGESFPLHGLKNAEAKNDVVDWQPT